MTFHRTAGTGGSRNSRRERHATDLPNFNKSIGSGVNRKGKKKLNPPTNGGTTPEARRKRYNRMMDPHQSVPRTGEEIMGGMMTRKKSEITGRW